MGMAGERGYGMRNVMVGWSLGVSLRGGLPPSGGWMDGWVYGCICGV